MLQYSIWRILLFVLFLLVFMWVGAPPIWALVGAMLFSMVTSWFLLRKQRNEMAAQVEQGIERRRERRQQKLASERTDEEVEDADYDDAEADGDERER